MDNVIAIILAIYNKLAEYVTQRDNNSKAAVVAIDALVHGDVQHADSINQLNVIAASSQQVSDAIDGQSDTSAASLAGIEEKVDELRAAFVLGYSLLADSVNCVCDAVNNLNAGNQLSPYLPTEPSPEPPVEPPDYGDASPGGHPSWSSYYCGGGVKLANAIAGLADSVGDLNLMGVVTITGLLAAIAAAFGAGTGGVGYIAAMGLALQIWNAIGEIAEWGIDVVMSEISTQFRDNEALRSCISAAMADGDGVAGKLDMLKEAIDNSYTGQHGGDIAKLFVLERWVQELTNGYTKDDGTIGWWETPIGVNCACVPCSSLVPVDVLSVENPNSSITAFTVDIVGNQARVQGIMPSSSNNVRLGVLHCVPAGESYPGIVLQALGEISIPGLFNAQGSGDVGYDASGLADGLFFVRDDMDLVDYSECPFEITSSVDDNDGNPADTTFELRFTGIPVAPFEFDLTIRIWGRA